MDFSPLWISLKVAVCATVFTFFLGLLSARLVLSLRAGKALIDGIFSLPMVLPPTVVGFFLLIIFGKNSLLGGLLLKMGSRQWWYLFPSCTGQPAAPWSRWM